MTNDRLQRSNEYLGKDRDELRAIIIERDIELERLKETLMCPRLTPDAPTEQYKAVLADVDKGLPVNGQDLINALWWRIGNQKREIARLHDQLPIKG